jgi:hypothetical protein
MTCERTRSAACPDVSVPPFRHLSRGGSHSLATVRFRTAWVPIPMMASPVLCLVGCGNGTASADDVLRICAEYLHVKDDGPEASTVRSLGPDAWEVTIRLPGGATGGCTTTVRDGVEETVVLGSAPGSRE